MDPICYKSTVQEWFDSFADNENNILSLEIIQNSSSYVLFGCGSEQIKILMPPMYSLYSISYDGSDDFVVRLSKLINTWISQNLQIISSPIQILIELASVATKLLIEDEKDTMDEAEYDEEGLDTTDTTALDDTAVGKCAISGIASAAPPTTWLDEHNMRRRWIEKEIQIREQHFSGEKIPELSSIHPTSNDVENIFSAEVSSKVLIGDLMSLIKESSELGYDVEAIDDNIYNWRIRFKKFAYDSEFNVDLTSLEDLFGYSYVEIQLSFAIDLYPFYPPLVTIIRPRFEGFMLGKIASLDSAKLSCWNLVHGLREILRDIKKEIESSGRIHLDSELNDISKFPGGSYSHLEHLLLKLGMVTEMTPRISLQFHPNKSILLPKLSAKSASKSTSMPITIPILAPNSSAASSQEFSASTDSVVSSSLSLPLSSSQQSYSGRGKGVGYGSGSRQGDWDIMQYHAAKAEKDRLYKSIIEEIYLFLVRSSDADSLNDGEGRFFATNVSIQSSRWARILEESCLIPVLESDISATSFLEMDLRPDIFRTIFMITELLMSTTEYHPLMMSLPGQQRSLQQLLGDLEFTHKIYERQVSKIKYSSSTESVLTILKSNPCKIAPEVDKERNEEGDLSGPIGTEDSVLLAIKKITISLTAFSKLYDSSTSDGLVKDFFGSRNYGVNKKQRQSNPTSPFPSAVGVSEDIVSESDISNNDRHQYIELMKNLQYLESDKLAGYHYRNNLGAADIASNLKKRIRRLASENADLSNSLPLEWSSSVWIRVSTERMDAMQSIISGPDETPYSNGLFLFDLYFPATYPSAPPLVNLQTTGRGTVRFNPNLYRCGKVCLSLLGTWHGKSSESWNEDVSTIRQVLLSIQSLILVPDPYFNEPGYEKTMDTFEGQRNSQAYNDEIKEQSIRWAMLDHLENPKVGFEDVIYHHFRFKKREILEQVGRWISTARTGSDHHDTLVTMERKLKLLLDKLEPPTHNLVYQK